MSANTKAGEASISWSLSANDSFQDLAHFPEQIQWLDHDPIDQVLSWPEYFRSVRGLPPGTTRVYVRFRSSGPALDSIRLAAYARENPPHGRLTLTQVWLENGRRREHIERFVAAERDRQFTIEAGQDVRNKTVILAAE